MKKETHIHFNKVNKSFSGTSVLKDFSIDIAPYEVVSIIGPSGSGKSTLLRILMTLENIDSGYVEIRGMSVWHEKKNGSLVEASEKHLREVRKKVGMVFQHFNLFPHMTVLRNITEAPVHVLGLSKTEANERAMELLRQVGLSGKAHAFPAQLSGGQKQRVGIARALAMQPEVLLLDEITSALDPELVGEVLDVIRTLAQEHRYTMLIVTHEMYFAQEVSDRVIFIDNGKVVETAKPEKMFTSPAKKRTRDFLQSYLQQF